MTGESEVGKRRPSVSRLPIVLYWLHIPLAGLVILGAWIYAERAGLLKKGVAPEVGAAIKRRVVIAQALYAIGAALVLIHPYVSIGWIVVGQLIFAVGPRLRVMPRA